MSDLHTLPVVVLYNCDFDERSGDTGTAARADVQQTAGAVAEALATDPTLAVTTMAVNADADLVVSALRRDPPALVFNLTESLGADARHEVLVPALLDFIGVPYTGSNGLTLGLALHKELCKDLLRARGVTTPPAVLLQRPEEADAVDLGFPLIVKPAREDGSIGISAASVVNDRRELAARAAEVIDTMRQPVLCERYVDGREIYVSLLGNEPREVLPFSEIDFGALPGHLPRIVTYDGKWDSSSPEFHGTRPVPCEDLPPAVAERVRQTALAAAEAIGVRDYGRVDVRLDAGGTPYVIDVNPNCDLSRTAGYARACAAAGLSYADLVRRLCRFALGRAPVAPVRPADPGRVPLAAAGGGGPWPT